MAASKARQLLMIGLGTAVAPLDTAVNIAFPAITRGFDLSIGDIQWVVIGYVLTYASLMLAFGRIGDMVGHAVVFRIGLLWSAAAFLLCALAGDFAWLVVCRVLQGIGAALVLSCGVALSTSLYAEERRSRVIGVYTMMMGVGSAVGPWLGGALVQAWDWPAVFWFRVPIALAALVLLGDFPATRRTMARERFDVLGAGLLVLALVALLLALNRIGQLAALPLGLLALAALAGFVRRELRVAHPIVDLRVFRVPHFPLLNLASVLTNLAAFAVWLLVPYYLARASDLSLTTAGAVLASNWVGAVVAAPLAGRLVGRVPARGLAVAGAALVGVGLLLVARWDGATSTPVLIAALIVQGIGVGLFQLAYVDIVAATMPLHSRGVAGSLAMMTRTLGVVGAASMLTLLFEGLAARHGFLAAFERSFELAALVAFAMAGLLAWSARRGRDPG